MDLEVAGYEKKTNLLQNQYLQTRTKVLHLTTTTDYFWTKVLYLDDTKIELAPITGEALLSMVIVASCSVAVFYEGN